MTASLASLSVITVDRVRDYVVVVDEFVRICSRWSGERLKVDGWNKLLNELGASNPTGSR